MSNRNKLIYVLGLGSFTALVIMLSLLLEPFDGPFNIYVKTNLFRVKDHTACIASAVEWEVGKKLGLCERNNSGVDGYSDGILYDSSDEILLPRDHHPLKWKNTVRNLWPDITQWNERFVFVTPINEQFYFVNISVSAIEAAFESQSYNNVQLLLSLNRVENISKNTHIRNPFPPQLVVASSHSSWLEE